MRGTPEGAGEGGWGARGGVPGGAGGGVPGGQGPAQIRWLQGQPWLRRSGKIRVYAHRQPV